MLFGRKHWIWLSIICVLLGMISIACDDDDNWVWDSKHKASEEFEYSIMTGNQEGLRLNAINGSIEVEGVSNTASVEITGERIVKSDASQSEAEAHLEELSVNIEESEKELLIQTIQPEHPDDGINYEVRYRIRLPEAWWVEIEQVNGAIQVQSIRSDARLRTINGEVSVDTCFGNLEATASNGAIRFRDVAGNVDARVSNGGIDGRLAEATVSTCRLKTINGGISLSIPRTVSAMFSAQVSNGDIDTSDVPIVSEEVTPRRVSGKIGDGEGVIDLSTANGGIVVTVAD